MARGRVKRVRSGAAHKAAGTRTQGSSTETARRRSLTMGERPNPASADQRAANAPPGFGWDGATDTYVKAYGSSNHKKAGGTKLGTHGKHVQAIADRRIAAPPKPPKATTHLRGTGSGRKSGGARNQTEAKSTYVPPAKRKAGAKAS